MKRRVLLRFLAVSLALGPRAASAQRSGPARIGWLSYLPEPDPALGLIREGLRALGYVEGTSYVLTARYANGDFTRLPKLVEELAAVHWQAADDKKIYNYNYEATKMAVKNAMAGKPSVDEMLAGKDAAAHPFRGF